MSFLKSMDISASALTAQSLRMDVIAENIANANTTRTADGQPYRRQTVTFEQREQAPFSNYLDEEMGGSSSGGVRVASITEDQSPFKMVYDPSHPDADQNGYVRMPNVDTAQEMVDMISATRSYEANITAINSYKSMALKALEIGK